MLIKQSIIIEETLYLNKIFQMTQNQNSLPLRDLLLSNSKTSNSFKKSNMNQSFALYDISNLGQAPRLSSISSKNTQVTHDGLEQHKIQTSSEEGQQNVNPIRQAKPNKKSIDRHSLCPSKVSTVQDIKMARFSVIVPACVKQEDEGEDKTVDMLREMLRLLNDDKQPSSAQKILLKKVQQLKMSLIKLQKQQPALEQQNRKLKDETRALRRNSAIYESRSEWWQKQACKKDMQVIRKMNSNYLCQLKALNAHNSPKSILSKTFRK